MGNGTARWYPKVFAGKDPESGCLLLRPVVSPAKTFPPWGQAEPAEGQHFRPSRADTEHPASWMLTTAKPHPWRPNMGLTELSKPHLLPTPPVYMCFFVLVWYRH